MNPADWDTGKFVTPATPPTFIGHSTGDTGEPRILACLVAVDSDGFVLIVAICARFESAGVTAADHSDPYFAALQANGVDAQYERVDFGGHGCVRLQNIAPRRCLS